MRRPAKVRSGQPRPAEICGQLLRAMEASEGRRRRRKRDTTPDASGLSIKQRLLEAAVRCDPDAGEFERWLLARCADPAPQPEPAGARLAMARAVLEEWRLACSSSGFRSWLRSGAPSDDR
jgi:hypothetical protein